MSRLVHGSDAFTQCSKCKFEYLPFSKKAASECPKCKAEIESDEDYLRNERRTTEEVNCDDFFEKPEGLW